MNSVHTIDCEYLWPQMAAAYLLKDGNRAAFVDNNTAYSVPKLLNALEQAGLSPSDVEYVIITHVHLDHAGGTSALMNACPNATLLAHPRAAVHMIDPSKLVASARKVYGNEAFDKLYGEIGPIAQERVRSVEDGEEIPFGSRMLWFLHTRGHANHHFCIYDSGSQGIFTGDSFGLAYPRLQRHGLFIFPSTSPTDFDPGEAKKSIERILATGAQRAYLTHFGMVDNLPSAASQLLIHLDFSEALLKQAIQSSLPDQDLTPFCQKELFSHFEKTMKAQGFQMDKEVWEVLKLDLELNAAGIAHVAKKKRTQGS
jgi:glyoxylase-like metal-dependent hydrolase (beta-lactamase superfamily II)